MLRPYPLEFFFRLTALTLLAGGLFLLRADDSPAPTPPPGYKLVYHEDGSGHKTPIFVKDLIDPLSHAQGIEVDPLDHQRVFSETNPMSNKTFLPPDAGNWAKATNPDGQESFTTKVYNTSADRNVYNLGSKPTFQTSTYEGVKNADGFDKNYATKAADLGPNQQAASEFAAIGSNDQNRTAPIPATPYDTYAAPNANKTFAGPEEDARHRKISRLSNGQLLIDDLPDRPLSIDEVKSLINHGFKPDTTQAPPPASRPLNDPNYQPEPLRIEPTEAETPTPPNGHSKVQDDDANDPVPSPGTMAEPPENSQPLPSK